MRGTAKGSVVLGLVLLVAACGTTPRAVTSQTGGPAQPSTITGLTLNFIAAQPCHRIAPVTTGYVGRCIFGSGAGGDAITGPALIRDDGAVTLLPDPYNFRKYFSDGADNLLAQETEGAPLLVIEPTSGAVKKTIPLPYSDTGLEGLAGTAAILVGFETSGDGKRMGRVMAFDVSGAKKWDVPIPDFAERWQVEVTPAGVFVLDDEVDVKTMSRSAAHTTMLRLDDGSTLWDASGKVRVAPGRVGRTVFYDDAGVPRSLATGAPTGRGRGPSAGAVAYEDDLILTSPLRRMTPKGETVWTLQDTSGTPATDGKTLVVLGTNDLVVLDPATGRRLGQAPDPSAPLNPCDTTELIVTTPRVIIAGACTRAGTSVYTVNM